jgi:molybdopterin converting factor small subunit
MPVVLLPSLLAREAGGQKRFEVEAATLRDALRQLPIANLIFDEAGERRALVNVFVDGADERDLDRPLEEDAEIRIVAAIAGGSGGGRRPPELLTAEGGTVERA